jgi:hypothetical protein
MNAFNEQNYDYLDRVSGAARHEAVINRSTIPEEVREHSAIICELKSSHAETVERRIKGMDGESARRRIAAVVKGCKAALKKVEAIQARQAEDRLAAEWGFPPGSVIGLSSRFGACKWDISEMLNAVTAPMHPLVESIVTLARISFGYIWVCRLVIDCGIERLAPPVTRTGRRYFQHEFDS